MIHAMHDRGANVANMYVPLKNTVWSYGLSHFPSASVIMKVESHFTQEVISNIPTILLSHGVLVNYSH